MGEPVVTRFAPSPTGHLHVGGARTALFNWALARSQGGRFLLRIEDTDRARSSAGAVAGILEDLAWLGLGWDEGPPLPAAGLGGDPRGVGPFFQSERLGRYQEAVDALVAEDRAYPAFEAPEELEALRREAQRARRSFRYRRPTGWDREAALARMQDEPHVIRFRMPQDAITVEDRILGHVHFAPEQLDDFVLRKRDGFPTYHLAVVVDDDAMGVSHVLRGQEHLNNTPRHVALQRALGLRVPVFAHLPIIQNPDGAKMSKRDKDRAAREALRRALADEPDRSRSLAEAAVSWSRLGPWLDDPRAQLETFELDALAATLELELPGVTVEDFRRGGYLPEVVVNFLALLGWSPGEKGEDGRDLERFGPAYLAERFSLERVGRGNARFDREKLLAFDQESIAALAPAELAERWHAWCARYSPALAGAFEGERLAWAVAAAQPRVRTLAEIGSAQGPLGFALVAEGAYAYEAKAVAKWLHRGDPPGIARLRAVRELLAGVEPFAPEPIEAAVQAHCEGLGIGMGKVAQPLRVAVTGSAASPPLGLTLALLGRASTLARIDRCLAELG